MKTRTTIKPRRQRTTQRPKDALAKTPKPHSTKAVTVRPSQTITNKPRRPKTTPKKQKFELKTTSKPFTPTEAVTRRPALTTTLPKYQQTFAKVLTKIDTKITPKPLTMKIQLNSRAW